MAITICYKVSFFWNKKRKHSSGIQQLHVKSSRFNMNNDHRNVENGVNGWEREKGYIDKQTGKISDMLPCQWWNRGMRRGLHWCKWWWRHEIMLYNVRCNRRGRVDRCRHVDILKCARWRFCGKSMVCGRTLSTPKAIKVANGVCLGRKVISPDASDGLHQRLVSENATSVSSKLQDRASC